MWTSYVAQHPPPRLKADLSGRARSLRRGKTRARCAERIYWNDRLASGASACLLRCPSSVASSCSALRPAARELVGRNVNDRSGRDAGELQDLVVNLGSGRVRHAVLTLDRSERQVTIAPARLSARAPAADLVVEIYLAELRALVAAGL
jgi:hypothetical protein